MSKGSNSTVTNVQQLPPAIAAALNTAYTDFNPFQQAFDAVGDFDPTATKVGTAGLSTGESNAITAANNLLANQPAFLGAAQQNLGDLVGGAVDTTALQNQLGLTADTSNLQNLLGVTTDTSGITDMAGQQNAATNLLTGLAGGGTNPFLQQQIDDAIGGAVDNTALANQLGLTADTTNLQNLLGATTDTSGILNAAQNATDVSNIMAAGGQQNAATNLLSGLAGGGTNPFLAAQLENAIGGAVDKVSSQYALGGRLGSDSFAGALGAGITGAAAPILSQNLQQDRANQLAAAQALGQVSGQDIGRSLQAAQSAAGIQQSDLGRALQGATTAAQIGQQDLGQQGNIAQSLLGAQQADLGRDATLANQLTAASEADARARLAAIGAAPGLLGADQALISQAAQLGGLARGVDQAALDATAAQANQQNILDQNQINALLSAAGMGGGLFGQTTTQTGGGPSSLSKAAGGALTGAALANAIPAAGVSGGLGAALGAGLSLFSDKRLKKDIKQIGTHANGLAMYSWQWNDEAQSRGFDIYPTEGFMAQEAREVYPQHVHVHPSGYLMLDYASLSNETMGAA